MKQYNKQNIPFARELRNNMTPWERKLWYDFLSRYPVRFQRQKAIGNYIVDFYCAKAKLAVELDGGGHYEPGQAQADALRTAELEKMGLSVIRVCNLDIDQNFRGVCDFLDQQVQKSLPQSASLTAPSSEGALAQPKIFALGFFDGVHLGHQALLKACVQLAQAQHAQPAAITFDRHPHALFSATVPPLINTGDDREQLLRQQGIRQITVLPTTKDVMSTSWEQFLEALVHRDAIGFVCGEDFRFGHRGEGNTEKLRLFCAQRDLLCVIVPEEKVDGIRVSSTHIRSLLEQGDVEKAAQFLGHRHLLSGEVTPGRQLGRTIGIPTANIPIPEGVIVPKLGVYACLAEVDGKQYPAVTNIGSRPTVGGHEVRAESWLLDFDGDLYGKKLTLEFCAFLRPETRFDSLALLKQQILWDAKQVRAHLTEG